MHFEKNEITKIILGLVVASSSSSVFAASAWDCQETDKGWSCAAAPDYKPEPVPLTRISAPTESYRTSDTDTLVSSKPEPTPEPAPVKKPTVAC